MKKILVIALFLLASCTSMQMSYDSKIKNKKDNTSQVFHYEKSYDLGYWCPITGILYGGYCWVYLGYPKSEHVDTTRTDAENKLNQLLGLGNWEILSTPIIEKKSWSNFPENSFFHDGELLNNSRFVMTDPKSGELQYTEKDFFISFNFVPIDTTSNMLANFNSEASGADYDLKFEIKNNSKNLIKIHWDECLYVDLDNKSKAVIHEGVKFLNKELPQAPSAIAPSSSSAHIIIPKENINFVTSKWYFAPYDFNKNAGKEFSIILSIEHSGKKESKSFKFIVAK